MLRSIPNAASAMLLTLQGRASHLGAPAGKNPSPRGAFDRACAPHLPGARGGPCPACAWRQSPAPRGSVVVGRGRNTGRDRCMDATVLISGVELLGVLRVDEAGIPGFL